MARGLKRAGGNILKKWIQNNQITFINASVTVILIIIVISVLLIQGAILQRRTAEESLVSLAGLSAGELQSHLISQFDTARGIWQLMSNYKNLEPERRRPFLTDIMRAGANSNQTLMNLFSLWLPGELDGMDAAYANTVGSSETGQFMGGFTRERGWVEERTFSDFAFTLDAKNYQDFFGYGVEAISTPRTGSAVNPFLPMAEFGNLTPSQREIWVVDLQIPFLSERSLNSQADISGVMGVTVGLDRLQSLCEESTPYESGRIFICANDGTIIAHPELERRGTNILTGQSEDLPYSEEELVRVRETIQSSLATRSPVILRTVDTILVSHPISTTSTMTMTTVTQNAARTPPWVLVTVVPMAAVMGPIYALLRFSILFVVGAALLMVFVLLMTSRSFTQHTRRLQQALEQSTALQDNLRYGLFLMDKNFVIQGVYSKALEKILSVSNLHERKFPELLSSSVKEAERQGLADYFGMVFQDAFDRDMLENLNPISDFIYTSTETGEIKSLRTAFSLVSQGRGSTYMLGIVEDITAEKELQKQIRESESRRENEMRSLFQVIQLDPRVLSDFVVDAEYEFDTINQMLKNRKELKPEVLVDLYQSVHAIKSNALILNLDDFSGRLHKLENSIRILREKHDRTVPFDEFLGLILELNEAMKALDQLKDAVSKIESFKTAAEAGGGENQERYVLVETLTRVCKKTQTALNKKAKFIVEDIDPVVLDYGPRRAIKEVLTQLVRNAVYHGIESPEDRALKSKKPEGEIRLSIRHKESQIVIKLGDDGGGIDFNRLHEKAVASHFFRDTHEADDRNKLLKMLFSPGFSTLGNADLHAGRGVGLSLVRDRVKELHGNISVATTGKGTTFTINIPLELPEVEKNVS